MAPESEFFFHTKQESDSSFLEMKKYLINIFLWKIHGQIIHLFIFCIFQVKIAALNVLLYICMWPLDIRYRITCLCYVIMIYKTFRICDKKILSKRKAQLYVHPITNNKWVMVMVFNATFNNISVISWRSLVLLMKEIGVPGENHRHVASHC